MSPRQAFVILTIPISSIVLPISLAQELETLKDTTERWIQTRNRISKEQSEWISEKELIEGSIDTLTSTRDILKDNVQILETQSRALQSKITETNARVETYEKSNTTILEQVSVYEKRILDLNNALPDPLKEKIASLIRKIPENDQSKTPVPNRLQNVIAIASIIDEFNNNLTHSNIIKTLDNGDVIQVRILNWGLAGAYASNAEGSKAWIISPTANGWKWTADTENTDAIKRLFDVYDKTIDPTLVAIPFSFQKQGGEG